MDMMGLQIKVSFLVQLRLEGEAKPLLSWVTVGTSGGEAQKGLLHRRYTDVQKIKVAEYTRQHGLRPGERGFGIHRRSIGQWLEVRLNEVKERKRRKKSNRPGQGRKLTYPVEIDDKLLQWLLEARDLQVAISSEMLKQKAKLLICPVQPDFKCSNGWVEKFFRCVYIGNLVGTLNQEVRPAFMSYLSQASQPCATCTHIHGTEAPS